MMILQSDAASVLRVSEQLLIVSAPSKRGFATPSPVAVVDAVK
jgi:hypothetical protein